MEELRFADAFAHALYIVMSILVHTKLSPAQY